MQTQEQEIRRYLVTTFLPDVGENDIEVDYDLLENGVIDSLGLLTLIGWIEDHFDISVEDEDLSPEKFSSVAAITDYVLRSSAAPVGGARA